MKPSTESCSFSGGDNTQIKALTEDASNDSIASVVFQCKSRKPPYVPKNETGRQVTAKSFYLCLMAAFLFSCGLQLILATICIISYKSPYTYLTGSNVDKEPLTYIFISALLCLPCSVLYWIAHNNRKNYVLLPILILLLILSVGFLTTGGVLSFLNRKIIKFQRHVIPPRLIKNQYYTAMNSSMIKALETYEVNVLSRFAWDMVQQRLKCCGVNSGDDWFLIAASYPDTCCVISPCTYNNIYNRGCIHLMAYDISWGLNFITSLSTIDFLIEICALLFASFVYIRETMVNNDNEV